ncbi:HEAT repeat domain-containing protein [Actinoplanes sp. NPDC051851]|uniref:HEAT repeat domain-containing protein n=1 Tax=Actinoplanes sp. NPDC051851 TaxID=3154753 RepID=UPI00343071F7
MTSADSGLLRALSSGTSSTRLRAALAAGTHPHPDYLGTLIERCAIEPDFFVRDMLTWALTRLPARDVTPRVLTELTSEVPQARSQALHTLSKIQERSVYPAITGALLHDADDEVARAAWRAAAGLVPQDAAAALAAELVTELGRGDRTVRMSLSRALAVLGDVIEPALRTAIDSDDPNVSEHARVTAILYEDPDTGFDAAVAEARGAALADR